MNYDLCFLSNYIKNSYTNENEYTNDELWFQPIWIT